MAISQVGETDEVIGYVGKDRWPEAACKDDHIAEKGSGKSRPDCIEKLAFTGVMTETENDACDQNTELVLKDASIEDLFAKAGCQGY